MTWTLEDTIGAVICAVVIAAMVAENPWAILLIAFCAVWA